MLELFHSPSVDDVSVAAYVDGGGWEGFHDEGSVLRSLYCLFMWEVLFTSVPNVFVSPYQDAPLDLFFSSFYDNRYGTRWVSDGMM